MVPGATSGFNFIEPVQVGVLVGAAAATTGVGEAGAGGWIAACPVPIEQEHTSQWESDNASLIVGAASPLALQARETAVLEHQPWRVDCPASGMFCT